ncbi:uncharacterized protein [Zea mays]|uniref:Uncharacterized protein n=1 Tax=Zea mays TaxID=4577 RepID=C0HJA2_MAIZE|nr:uncharacterized protein LOC118476298 [Zea mays]ACN27105.1 unknown [Zea mays]|eukprot:NP_001168107.1 uncharacterized protein LOC100381845 [Zea mays]
MMVSSLSLTIRYSDVYARITQMKGSSHSPGIDVHQTTTDGDTILMTCMVVRKRRQAGIDLPTVPPYCAFPCSFLTSSSTLPLAELILSLTHAAPFVDRLSSLTVSLERKEETEYGRGRTE